MQPAEREPQLCGVCLGKLRRVRNVPLKSFEGQCIFECAVCGLLTVVLQQPTATRPAETRGARLLNLL